MQKGKIFSNLLQSSLCVVHRLGALTASSWSTPLLQTNEGQ